MAKSDIQVIETVFLTIEEGTTIILEGESYSGVVEVPVSIADTLIKTGRATNGSSTNL